MAGEGRFDSIPAASRKSQTKEEEMDRASVETEFRKVVRRQLLVTEEMITPESRFCEDLGADSLDRLELVMATEEAFDIEIPDTEAEELCTVYEAVNYLTARLTR